MSGRRGDVRRMLLARGWVESGDPPMLTKGDALWAAWSGTSGLDGRRGTPRKFTLTFEPEVPARVVVAACEAAVGVVS